MYIRLRVFIYPLIYSDAFNIFHYEIQKITRTFLFDNFLYRIMINAFASPLLHIELYDIGRII